MKPLLFKWLLRSLPIKGSHKELKKWGIEDIESGYYPGKLTIYVKI